MGMVDCFVDYRGGILVLVVVGNVENREIQISMKMPSRAQVLINTEKRGFFDFRNRYSSSDNRLLLLLLFLSRSHRDFIEFEFEPSIDKTKPKRQAQTFVPVFDS